jgi:hypothetical protein
MSLGGICKLGGNGRWWARREGGREGGREIGPAFNESGLDA